MTEKLLTVRELFDLILTIPAPTKIVRDIKLNGVLYHAVVYRQKQDGRDVVGADIRSIIPKPTNKTRRDSNEKISQG
jgi:hypothetical protein